MTSRRTKIVATLGPALDNPEMLKRTLQAGVNVVRANFSHGSTKEHQDRIAAVRACAAQLNLTVGILADLQGPKIRISTFKNGRIHLTEGEPFSLDADLDPLEGTQQCVGIDYKALPNDVHPGQTLSLDDGRIQLQVESTKAHQINCRVLIGGELSNHKGINLQGGGLSAKSITDKDKKDLQTALDLGVDYVALSFPRNAKDIQEARQLLGERGRHIGLIAKIERAEAVTAIDEIIQAADGIMVARGDLAVEIGDAEVPRVQKHIIARTRDLNKPVITATQMMESMIYKETPTRAEVSDVANAVLDGSDAIMLSAETAVGKYPDLVVSAVSRICLSAEKHPSVQTSRHRIDRHFNRVDEAIAMATMYAANHLNIKAIIALTESGMTALWMSRIDTTLPIYGLSRHPTTCGKMSLYRGVHPITFDVTQLPRAEINKAAIRELQRHNLVSAGDLVVITKGDFIGIHGTSNAMKILHVEEETQRAMD